MKVVFATPSLTGPTEPYIKSLEASLPLIEAAGWSHAYSQEIGNPYISAARASMTRKAIDYGADVVVYLDYDVSWDPKDLLALIESEGEVVMGTYRYKQEEEKYMGAIFTDDEGRPIVRNDGCLKTQCGPAGFLKITKIGIQAFARMYPHLLFGDPLSPTVDLFNHGAFNGVWFGEDYAFCRNWINGGGEIWTIPDLNINHHITDKDRKSTKEFKGNYHEFLLRLPGGSSYEDHRTGE